MSHVGFSEDSFRSPEVFEIFVSSLYTRLYNSLISKERYLDDCISRLTFLLEIAEQCSEESIIFELDNALGQFYVEKECITVAINSCTEKFKIAQEPLQASLPVSNELVLECVDDATVSVVHSYEMMTDLLPEVVSEELQMSTEVETLEVPCLPDPVLEQRFEKLNAVYMEWRDAFMIKGDAPGYDLWFELRAIACDLMALIVLASASRGNQDVMQACRQLLDSLQFDRHFGNDTTDCFPFPLTFSSITDTTEEQWTRLASDYRDMQFASKAWDWYVATASLDHINLINGVGAASQQLYRHLESLNGFDQLQFEFYNAVQSVCRKDNTYCKGLDSKISEGELKKLIRELPQYFESAKRVEKDEEIRAGKEARKRDAVNNLKKLFEDNPEFGLNMDTLTEDRETLKAHLDRCKEAGIPYSDSTVCALIMHCAANLLSGQNSYLQFLKYAMEKLKKSKTTEALEIAKEEVVKQAADPELTNWVELLKPVVANKHLLILGGEKCKDAVCCKLKELLPLTECIWGYGNSKATVGHYRTKIKNADITIVAIAFAGHDMSEKGKKWATEAGKDFIQNLSGMGLKSIVKTLFDHYRMKGMIQINN